VDVSKRGGSGESKEQQLLKPNRKIHDHSFIHSFIDARLSSRANLQYPPV
jgi:hypothetical protein